MEKEIREAKEQIEKLEKLYKTSEFIRDFDDKMMTYSSNIACILLRVTSDYEKLVDTLKKVRKISDNLKLTNNWYSCGVMLFSWKSELVDVWFKCNPEEIPEKLMPSTSCKVVKTERTIEEDYRIVCDVNNPV